MPGFIGLPEILLLGLVALILFGPKRLPEMGRGLGKGLREFKDSVTGDNKGEDMLVLPQELTAAPTAPDPLTTAAHVTLAPVSATPVETVAVVHREVA